MLERRTLALLAAAVLVLGAVGLVAGRGDVGTRASDDHGPTGTAALAGVYRRMGLEVESLRVGLNALRRVPSGSVLFLISAPSLLPVSPPGPAELGRLERWVEEGNTAVVVTGYASPFLERLGPPYAWDALDPLGRERSERAALPILPDPLTLGGALALRGRGAFELHGPEDEPLFAVDGHAVAVRRPLGYGRVIAVADPYTVENRGLSAGANVEFYATLVRRHLHPGGRVLFDDLHAGGGDDLGVVAYARRVGLTPTLLIALLLAGAYLWRVAARFGPPLPAADRCPPRATSELVAAIGGLYERAGLHHHALTLLSRRFRRRMEARSGLRWKKEDLERWVRAELGPDAARRFARLRRGFGALLAEPEPDPAAVLALARQVHHFETTWLDGSSRRPRPSPEPR